MNSSKQRDTIRNGGCYTHCNLSNLKTESRDCNNVCKINATGTYHS